jgi:outer membrane murein-binding lipoprotein Lpp
MKRMVRVVLLVAGVTLVAGACSSSKKDTVSADSTAAPEDARTSAANVATGLKQIEATAADIAKAAGTDKARAQELDAKIEPVWKTIEGTVKANDQDSYITFEDNFAVLEKAAKDDDATKAQQGSDAVAKAVSAYLAKYPG